MPHGDAVGDGDGAEFARVPPAEATPFLTAWAWRISEMLQGAASFQQLAKTPKRRLMEICSRVSPSRNKIGAMRRALGPRSHAGLAVAT